MMMLLLLLLQALYKLHLKVVHCEAREDIKT